MCPMSNSERSEAARQMGQVRSERKAAAARENGKLGGSGYKPLLDIPCNCGGGESFDLQAHKSTCLRYRAIKRRVDAEKPLQ